MVACLHIKKTLMHTRTDQLQSQGGNKRNKTVIQLLFVGPDESLKYNELNKQKRAIINNILTSPTGISCAREPESITSQHKNIIIPIGNT